MKLPCKTCICFALCKSKISLSSIVLECDILDEMWLEEPDTEVTQKFLDGLKETFNKYD